MMQKEAKIKINSIYGSFGATTFQLYNIFTAAATTGTAQSLISTTAVAFEGFLSDNARFRSIDEFMIYVGDVLHKTDYTYNYNIVPVIRDPGKVYDRMVNHFLEGVEVTDSICDIIWRVLENCNEEQLTRLYYKNNLYDFIDTPIIHDIMLEIFNTATSFRNPMQFQRNSMGYWISCGIIRMSSYSIIMLTQNELTDWFIIREDRSSSSIPTPI